MNIQALTNPKNAAAYIAQQTGRQVRIERIIRELLWSSYLFSDTIAAGEYDVFATGEGQQGQGYGNVPLTWRETNLPTNGTLPQESDYIVFSVGVLIAEHKVKEETPPPVGQGRPWLLKQIAEHLVLWVDQPDYKRPFGLVEMLPAGHGITGFTVENNGSVLTNGAPAFHARLPINPPIVFRGGSTMKMKFRATGADGGLPITLLDDSSFDCWAVLDTLRITKVVTG